jgi:glutathione synthase/RimK-type ligase-like ATP-grasp enzyme
MRIAYVGYKVQEKYTQGISNDEDSELLLFLQQKGLEIDFVVWNDDTINWENYNIVLIKSPWDYHEKISLFYSWLENIKLLGLRMLNPLDIIKWNSNKRYLDDISKAGLPVIPSIYLDQGTQIPTDNLLFKQLNTDKIVVKPCVSAGAKNTIILDEVSIVQQAKNINLLLLEEEYIVQPFIKEIADGEWSFIFFNGQYSHSALKVPKQGDFRVQHYHGGSIIYPNPNAKHIQQAEKYVQKFAKGTLYARVDGIVIDETLCLMEIELIEPYLFLNAEMERQEHYYQALISLIS